MVKAVTGGASEIRELPVGQRVDQRDAVQPGLWIRKSPRTAKTQTVRPEELITYRVVYKRRSDGKVRQKKLGKASQIKLAEARRLAKSIMDQVAEGKDPAAEHGEWVNSVTFRELADQWLAFKRRQGRASAYLSESERRSRSLPDWFKAKKACDIQRIDVAKVLDKKADTGKRTETNRVHALLSAVFKWAVSEGHISQDPAQGLQKRFPEAPRERVLTDAEIRAIWNGIDSGYGSEASKIAMKLCFVLGQRPKEIVSIRQENITLDDSNPMIIVSAQSGKNRTEHWVPLPKMAVELLSKAKAIAGDSEWLFPNPTGTGSIQPKALTRLITRSKADQDGMLFGVPDAQLYDSKKTIATYLGDAGYPNELIGILFNHLSAKSGTVTGRHYNHSGYLKTKRELIELWARHLEIVVGHN